MDPSTTAELAARYPAAFPRAFLGRFQGGAGGDLLVVDGVRNSLLSRTVNRALVSYGLDTY